MLATPAARILTNTKIFVELATKLVLFLRKANT